MTYGTKAAERLAKKTVLLTGASSGIGRATAHELAAAANGDIRFILVARRLEKLSDLQKELTSKYKSIEVLSQKLDVSDYKSIPQFLKGLPSEWSKINVLINNAGLAIGKETVGSIEANDIESMFYTNVLGLITLTNALIPQFKERGDGDIVNIGSIAGRQAYPGGSIYCATKASLRSFTSALRAETINSKIRVIEVDPGAVETEFSLVRFRGDQSQSDAVYKGTEPLVAEDIAEIITFALTRRINTVIAETLVFPNHQAGAAYIHRN